MNFFRSAAMLMCVLLLCFHATRMHVAVYGQESFFVKTVLEAYFLALQTTNKSGGFTNSFSLN